MQIIIISPVKKLKAQNKTKEVCEGRLYRLLQRLESIKIKSSDIHIIGVDGSEYEKYLDENLSNKWITGNLKYFKGHKARALSHLEALQYIKAHDFKEEFLVIEDDILITDNLLNITDQIKSLNKENFDILNLNTEMPCFMKQNPSIDDIFHKMVDNSITPTNSMAYIINSKNIDKILSSILPLNFTIQQSLLNNKDLNTYLINPVHSYVSREKKIKNEDSYMNKLNNFSNFLFLEFIDPNTHFQNISSNDLNNGQKTFKVLCHESMIAEEDFFKNFQLSIRYLIDDAIFVIKNFSLWPLSENCEYVTLGFQINGTNFPFEKGKGYILILEYKHEKSQLNKISNLCFNVI